MFITREYMGKKVTYASTLGKSQASSWTAASNAIIAVPLEYPCYMQGSIKARDTTGQSSISPNAYCPSS